MRGKDRSRLLFANPRHPRKIDQNLQLFSNPKIEWEIYIENAIHVAMSYLLIIVWRCSD